MKKPLLFPLSNTENIPPLLVLSGVAQTNKSDGSLLVKTPTKAEKPIFQLALFILMLLLGFQQVHAQIPSHNAALACIPNTLTADAKTKATTTYAGLTAHAIAGTQGPAVSITESWKVTTDANGNLGFFHGIQVNSTVANSTACINQTSNSRQYALYDYAGNVCTGSAIAPTFLTNGVVAGGSETNPMNPAWTGLSPNANYVIIVKTTVGASCLDLLNTYAGYYGIPPQFTFNCGTASSTGNFFANNATGQAGTLMIPLTGALAGTATFNVTGNGFTGTLTTTLTAGQASVTIPVTYNGTGAVGSHAVTVTTTGTGVGTCTPNINVLDGTDSDGDGIPNFTDLDDDNDGILDTEEECFGFRGQNTNGAWLGNTTSTATFSFPSSVSQSLVANYNDSQIKYYVNTNGGQPRLSRFGNMTYTASFSPAVPASEIAFYIFDLDGALHTSSNASYTISVNGSSANIPFSSANVGSPAMNYNSGTGVVSSAGVLDNQRIMLKGNSTTLVSSITITGTGISTADDVGYSFFGKKNCDTDNDNIPNYLDTDSDADGCSDAFEAGATTSTTANFQFPVASVGTNGLSSTVENNDTPTATTTYTSTYANATNNAIKNCCPTSTVPTLSATTKSNLCPATTADISGLVSSTCPSGSSLEWHTVATGFSAINKVANSSSVGAGTYYPVCFSSASTCYSPAPATGVTVTITTCAGPLTITQPTAITKPVSTLVQGTAPTDLSPSGGVGAIIYSNGSTDPACVAPVGATALSSPLTINSSTGQYSYTTPSTPGTYYFCVKVCDSTSPTPVCQFATYKVMVTPPACNAGTVAPGVN